LKVYFETKMQVGIQPTMVLGLEIADVEVADLVKRILYLSIGIAAYLSVLEIWRLVSAITRSTNLAR